MHHPVKLRKNMTSGFQLTSNFSVDKNAKIALKAKGQSTISPKSNQHHHHHHHTRIYSAPITNIGELQSHPYRHNSGYIRKT